MFHIPRATSEVLIIVCNALSGFKNSLVQNQLEIFNVHHDFIMKVSRMGDFGFYILLVLVVMRMHTPLYLIVAENLPVPP